MLTVGNVWDLDLYRYAYLLFDDLVCDLWTAAQPWNCVFELHNPFYSLLVGAAFVLFFSFLFSRVSYEGGIQSL